MQATYTQLRDGSWGIRVQGIVSANDLVMVIKKSGEEKEERVSKVLWSGTDSKTGNTITLCSISEKPRKPQSCDECGRAGATTLCRDSSGIQGVCCRRCAQLPHYERSFA